MIKRLALSGLIDSGKDHVAERAGFAVVSFAEPMYRLCERLFGSCRYKEPAFIDQRKFLQTIGQWGWGHHDRETCPHDPLRGAFTMLVRLHGSAMTAMSEVNWGQFGLSKTFWADALIARIRTMELDVPAARHAVTNCRFEHEREPLRRAGFEHYLVLCTEETRERRHGGPIPREINFDISEQFARDLANEFPDPQIIWNDDAPMPADHRYLTTDEFVSIAN